MLHRIVTLLLVVMLLAACGGTGATVASPSPAAESPAPAAESPAPSPEAGEASLEVETVTEDEYPNTITIMTHDSFSLSADVVAEFERANNVKVQFLSAGDAGSALNRALLTRGNPLADVFFGVDNTFFSRALEGDIFESYAPAGLEQIPEEFRLDPEHRLIPIDYGFVNLNYDKASELFAEIDDPEQMPLERLTEPQFRNAVVVQNPATSSPGLAFMLATIAYFGEDGWLDWWAQIRDNEVVVVDGWSTAYYTNFSGASETGTQPIVVSYSTSPAAEVFFSEGALEEPPTGNIFPPKAAFRQIEFAGILKGTPNLELAQRWMDYMISPAVQNDVMPQMVVYPVLPSAEIPDVYQRFAPLPPEPADIDPATIAQNRDRWIQEWTRTVLQ